MGLKSPGLKSPSTNGKTYDGCTKDGTAPFAPYSWCASDVDLSGNILKTGICDPDCPGVGKYFFFNVKNTITVDPHIS